MSLFDVYSQYDVTITKGKDVYVNDDKGIEYLDLYGGHAVISIGHSQPEFVSAIKKQLSELIFYSNALKNPLQEELAETLNKVSKLKDYQLFLCNSGAEANENALKLASFYTGRKKIIAFKNGFHGRTSAAVSVTDNESIIAPLNAQHEVELLEFEDFNALESSLNQGDVAAIIFESLQGIGGLDQPSEKFINQMISLCKTNGTIVIADEVQSGFGRTGDFFAFNHYNIKPDIISMAKGMGNGFPVGGILINPSFKAKKGMLGSTFGGNQLACTASLSVLHFLVNQNLMNKAKKCEIYFRKQIQELNINTNIKGRGLMLGFEFDFPVAKLRDKLLFKHQIITGSSKNKNLLRVLPPLSLQPHHIDKFLNALKIELE